jgi:hypothetical protein
MLNIKPSIYGDKCKVGNIADHLDDEDRKTYLEAIDDRETWSAYALEIALKQRGIFVSNDMIGLHRKGACRCRL